MSGWAHANRARSRYADERAAKLREALGVSRTFKEAAWRAGVPVRTARRYLARGEAR